MDAKAQQSLNLSHFGFPIAMLDGQGNLVECSQAFEVFFEQSLSAQNLKELLEAAQNIIHDPQFEANSPIQILEVHTKGNFKFIKLVVSPIVGVSNHFHLTLEDVTQRKEKYDLALRAKEIARIGSWSVDLVNNKVTWSQITREIHEVDNDFVPDLESGINFYKEGIHRERIVEVVSECIQSGTPYDVELIIVTAKGNEKWVRAMGKPEQVDGKTVSFSGVFQDINERKQQQLAYDSLNERMHIAIESANIGIWDYDITNNILIWDNKMYDLYGVEKDEFKGVFEAWESAVHPEDKERANIEVQNAISGKTKLDTEFRVVKKDGTVAYIHAEAKVFQDEKGVPYRMIGANNDVSRLKEKDERLSKLLEVTESQNRRLLNFTEIVSHNLRSNSSNISMLSGMLDDQLPIERQKQFIQMIKDSSINLEETIVQLNNIVKIQGTDKSQFKPVVIKDVLDSVIRGINGLVMDSQAKIKVNVDEGLRIPGIEAYFQSVFHNLFTNSIKYRNPDRPLEINITQNRSKSHISIAFADNGLGIDLKKNGSKIFGMHKTFHNNKDARGIGLFITKNHVEAMNGKIIVESQLDKGTTFMVSFKNQENRV